jgi:hypothetical protein
LWTSRDTITLSRGAGWHGIKDGIEGNYISTGDDLVRADSPEGLAILATMHSDAAIGGCWGVTGGETVGYRWTRL